MGYKDVREWIQKVGEMGELKVIEGADWNLEIGAISVLASKHKENSPALLFDKIKDYPAGYRILVGFFESLKRSALTTNLPLDITREGFIQAWRERLARPASIPPRTVSTGPVMQNVIKGDDIDLFKFPVPFWHERDGGRYIGTGHVVITRDPDEDWVNVGCYRVMVHDRNSMGMNISPGKHGRMHRQKYFDRGKACPVVCCFGVDPLLHMIATRPEPYGKSEFDAVGGIKGEPVEVIDGEFTGLPIPAHAEIAIEGEFLPDQGKEEGPFSEWTGYYASGEKFEPLIKVHRLYHRNDPIIQLRRNTGRRRAPSIAMNFCAPPIFATRWKKPACRMSRRWRVIFADFSPSSRFASVIPATPVKRGWSPANVRARRIWEDTWSWSMTISTPTISTMSFGPCVAGPTRWTPLRSCGATGAVLWIRSFRVNAKASARA